MNAIMAALVNGAAMGALITAAVWLILRLLPRRRLNAATRYIVWWVTLAITITLPVAYWPGRQFPHPAPAGVETTRISMPPQVRTIPMPATQHMLPDRPPLQVEATPATLPTVPAPHIETTPVPSWPRIPFRVTAAFSPSWLFGAWTLVSLLLLARLLVSYILMGRRSARAADAPPPLGARVDRWLASCGSRRRGVRLASSREIAAPVAVGPRRPSILMPVQLLDGLQTDDLDQLGVHEAAHLARRDDYALLVQRMIEALFALHPVVRWIARQIELEREIACDDFVVAATGRARSYAACLTTVVELAGGPQSSLAAATVAERRSHLSRRVDMLLDKARHTSTRPLAGRLAAIIAVLAALAWTAGQMPGLVAFATPLSQAAAQSPNPTPPEPLRTAPPVERLESPAGDPVGQVLEDSSGDPVASAEVRFRRAGMRELAAHLETDRQGRYSAPGLPPGDYIVKMSKPNYLETTFRLQVPAPAMLVRLVRYGVIDGQVTNVEGRPLSGQVVGRPGASARITVLAKAATGQLRVFREKLLWEGERYRIFDLPPGQYAVALWYGNLKEGSGMQFYPNNANPRWFTVNGGEEYDQVNFLVQPQALYKVSGKLNPPKPGATFSVALALPEQPILPLAQTETERDGSFSFERVPAGTYDLFAAGPTGGYTSSEWILGKGEPIFGRTRVQVIGQNLEGIDVPLGPGRSLKVALRSGGSGELPQGCPESATVTLESVEPWGTSLDSTAQVKFGGEETVRNLAPGRFRVSTRDLGAQCYLVNQPEVDLSGEAAPAIVVELGAAGAIRGVLAAGAGDPADFAVVLLAPGAAGDGQVQLAAPDERGRFGFEGLRPGRYRIAVKRAAEASRGRWVAGAATEVDVRGGAPTDVELAAPKTGGRP